MNWQNNWWWRTVEFIFLLYQFPQLVDAKIFRIFKKIIYPHGALACKCHNSACQCGWARGKDLFAPALSFKGAWTDGLESSLPIHSLFSSLPSSSTLMAAVLKCISGPVSRLP